MSQNRFLTRNIWVLSLVSLFTDMASELLYPIIPLYLQQIGFTVLFIGVLEGVAEAVSGVFKSYFGKLSDTLGKRKVFVQWGYGLSAAAKPAIALITAPAWVFLMRLADRLGKGLRTGARDALLSAEATPETKGRVFGFHRSMDTLGAVLGPMIALLWLKYHPGDYRTMFIVSVVPGLAAIVATSLIKERIENNTLQKAKKAPWWKYIFQTEPHLRKLLIVLTLFALFNSADVFLLLQVKKSGCSDYLLILVYIFYNLVYALASYPMGILGDKIGLKPTMVLGLIFFSVAYAGISFAASMPQYLAVFFIYGLYAASTDGVAKALISNMVPKTESATALGTFAALQSLAALVASSVAGLLWVSYGSQVTFLSSAIVACCCAVVLAVLKTKKPIVI